MSTSKGNVIAPDEYIARHGADAVRLYLPFLGPVDQDAEWQDSGFEGMVRFLHRLWRVTLDAAGRSSDVTTGTPLASKAHETIAKVTDDIGRRFALNTPIAAVMELVNAISREPGDPAARFAVETALSLIQPYAPHIAEELWERLAHERLWEQPWPEADPSQLERETFELVVQVNGKVRDRLQIDGDLPEDELVARAKASPRPGASRRARDPQDDRRAAEARESGRRLRRRHVKVPPMARVSEILRGKQSEVLKIDASATVFEAIKKIVEQNVGSILVTRDDDVVGIMTERDYLRKIAIFGRTSHDTLVGEIMSSPLMYVTPETTIEESMAIMTDRRIRHLPVVENDEVVGIVSIGDVVKFQSREQSFQIKYLTEYISGGR